MRKKMYWVISITIVLAIVFYNFYFSGVAAKTSTVGRGDIVHTITDTGYVQSSDQADIFAAQSGRINNLTIRVGQTVEKNQLLMVLENPDVKISAQQLQVGLSQARASANAARQALQQEELALSESRSNFERTRQLFKAGGVSQAEFDAAKTRLDQTELGVATAKNDLQSAQQQVSSYESLLNQALGKEKDLEVRSPISGTLMQLPVDPGKVVIYGALLARVASPENLEIKADLLSDDLKDVKLGQKVQITAPVLGDTVLNGEIIKIYPQAEEKLSALGVVQRRVPTIVKLERTDNLKPGYETRISIITARRSKVILVPRESVLTAADGSRQVMRVVKGRVIYQSVTTGLADSKNIEIKAGLNTGDKIITDASINLKENARVKS